MTDKEAMQMALDALEDFRGEYGWLPKQEKAWETLRARLAQPPKDLELPLVRPAEFVKLIQGKENYWGIPVMRTEWPMPELVIQAREEGDLIVADLPQVPTGGGGISKREWVGLTDEEVLADDVLRYHFALNGGAGPISKKGLAIIATVNAKLKEKNT